MVNILRIYILYLQERMDMCFKVHFIPYSSIMELKRKECVGNSSEKYVKNEKRKNY